MLHKNYIHFYILWEAINVKYTEFGRKLSDLNYETNFWPSFKINDISKLRTLGIKTLRISRILKKDMTELIKNYPEHYEAWVRNSLTMEKKLISDIKNINEIYAFCKEMNVVGNESN